MLARRVISGLVCASFALATAAAVLLVSAPARAQTTQFESARAQAMGGAFRALCYDNSAIDLNPAGLAQFRKVEIEPGYFRTVDGREYAASFSLADSLTNVSGTGFSFDYRKAKPDENGLGGFDSQRYTLGVGFPVLPDMAWVGFNTRYYKVNYTDPTLKDRNGFTSSVGVLYRPVKLLALGIDFDNMINGNQAEAPRTLTGGVAILPASWFAASADIWSDTASTPDDKTGWAIGAQVNPHHSVALRGGLYREALTGDQVWTAGIGLVGQSGSLDYAIRIPDGSTKIASHFITASLLVF